MHVASLIDSSTCVSCMFLCYMYVCVYMYMYSFIACYEVELHVYVRRMQVLGTKNASTRYSNSYSRSNSFCAWRVNMTLHGCVNVIKRHGFRK